ncbi:transcription elongation factor A protein-like 8 [Lagenorhynchus albirostris]|uniref:transcription elongation factor A protein-like 8 n=1 Tax=Lagenorhynchus albirostris TaxID=27610 RepID=UPI0028EBB4DF|nr:transcription elongation factor A protein-like 8 [Lagenorhynchus albirostris]
MGAEVLMLNNVGLFEEQKAGRPETPCVEGMRLRLRKILNTQKSCEENEGKAPNMPKAEEDRPMEAVPQEAERNPQPSEEGVSQEAEGNLRGGLTQPGQGYKEDTPVRHLDPEEMIRGVDELERLREETRRVRNTFVMMHWEQRHSRSRPHPVCFRP